MGQVIRHGTYRRFCRPPRTYGRSAIFLEVCLHEKAAKWMVSEFKFTEFT